MGLPKGYGSANNPAAETDEAHATAPDHSTKGHFVSGNRGAIKGAPFKIKRERRRVFTTKVLSDLLADWKEHGPSAIAACRLEDPSGYVRAAISLLPKDINVNVNPIEQMPDDRLLDYIRGLEETIVAAIAAGAGTTGGTEGGAGETIEHEEAQSLSSVH